MTRSLFSIIGIIGVLAVSSNASAATASGTLSVTGTVAGSIALTIESAGGTTSGLGTNAATSALGTISKYGAAPTAFTIARGASDWTLSSNVGVKVEKANLTSTDYMLTSQLSTTPATGVTWKLNGDAISTSPSTLAANGAYASTGSYSWDIVITNAAAAAAIDNVITFTATSN
jgi:hypothetical protein